MFKGQIVLAQGHGTTTFKITRLMENGQFATIQAFSVSKQILLGATVNVPTSMLIPFKEDANQAAARVVRESTGN
jgi:hypothetical protein